MVSIELSATDCELGVKKLVLKQGLGVKKLKLKYTIYCITEI
jgi:hypothetical protein